MKSLEQLLSNIQTNSDLLNFAGILLTAIVSIYIFKKESSTAFARERHDKLLFPLFDLLEPTLYQEVQTDLLQDALKIIEKNKNIADGKLLEIFYFCTHNPSQENFNKLCSYSDKMYDKSCLRLGLKLRSLNYRFFRNQYKHKASFFSFVILYSILFMCFGLAVFCVFLLILAALYALYVGTNSINQLVILVFLMALLMAFLKYFDKQS